MMAKLTDYKYGGSGELSVNQAINSRKALTHCTIMALPELDEAERARKILTRFTTGPMGYS